MFELVPTSSAHDVLQQASEWGPGASLLSSPPVLDDDVLLLDQILAVVRSHQLDEPTDICDFAVDALDAELLLARVPRPMSRGERQICGLLLALAPPFETLFVVDPTAGLDLSRRKAVHQLLLDCAELTPNAKVVCASDDPVFTDPGT